MKIGFSRGHLFSLVALSLVATSPVPVWAQTPHGPGGVKVNRFPNMDAPGNDVKWVRGVASVEQCESLCLADSACAGYTYNVARNTCIPKTAIGPLSPTRESAVTGIVERRTGSAHAEDTAGSSGGKVTRYPNMDAPGSDAKWVRGVASVEQCENLCIADSACAGYTYNIKQSACFLKTAIGPLAPSSIPTVTGVVDRQSGNRAIMVEGKPSFDCRQARDDTERIICASPSLGRLDVQLAELYRTRVAQLQGPSGDGERRRQRDWIGARKQCVASSSCLEKIYKQRITELGGQALAATAPPSQAPPPPAQQAPDQKPQPEAEARTQGPIGTVQQLPNPIRLIGRADQPCDQASATLARLRQGLSISVPDNKVVPADGLRTIEWKTSGAAPDGPAYLVLATDGPVRFRGKGFYALTSDAAAPFRIKQFLKQTRVIIPLHVKGAPMSGELAIRPLVAGPLHLSFGIIGYTQCGENLDPAPIKFEFTVEPGAPEIVIADRFDLAKPDQIIASPDATRRLEAYGPRYRLIDVATGALLADEIGAEPRFSPTGRFVIARSANRYEIRDVVDGKLVQRTSDTIRYAETADIAWDDRDSFIIAGTYVQYGATPIQIALKEGDEDFNDGGNGCGHVSVSVGDVALKLDLENNIVVSSCDYSEAPGASSLTVRSAEKEPKSDNNQDLMGASLVLPFTAPKGWATIDGLKFTHFNKWLNDFKESPSDETIGKRLSPFVVRPIIVTKSDAHVPIVDKDPLRIASRGISPVNLSDTTRSSRIEERLRTFGIELNRGTPMVWLAPTSALKLIRGAPKNSEVIKYFKFVGDQSIDVVVNPEADATGDCGYDPRTGGGGGGKLRVSREDKLFAQMHVQEFQLTVVNGSCTGGSEHFNYINAYLHDSRRPGQLWDLRGQFAETVGGGPGVTCEEDSFFACEFYAELFFNRYLVVWSQQSHAAAVYDIEERKLLRQLEGLSYPDVMQRISLSKDLKTVVKLDNDGGFQVIGLRQGERDTEGHMTEASTKVDVLLSGRIVDDEVAIWTPSGKFDSTPEGASHVALRFLGRSGEYTLEQFHKFFHADNLLKRAMAGEEFKAPRVTDFPPVIAVAPNFTGESVAAKINLFGDDPVEEIRVYQDGLMTDAIKVAGDAKTIDVNAKRLPGARWVAFLARGPSGLYSQPATFDAGLGASPRRRVRLISIGIDHYDDSRIRQLIFAGSDAARFAKTLQEKAGSSVEIISQSLLLDAAASREAILAKLNETITKAEPGDSVILFIAGHGVEAPDKNYYLATSATKVDDIAHTALPWGDLASVLAKAHTRIAVFLDTCQSGAAGTGFFATNDASVSALLDRAPSGILIFSASKGREESEESAGQGGGVFTSAVIAALSDPKTDRNHNGAIEASELYATVKRAVVEATEGRQTPWFARNDMVGDFVPF